MAVLFKQTPATNKNMKPENKNTSKMRGKKYLLTSLLVFLLLKFCISSDTITIDKPLKDGDVLISRGEYFALGFFSPGNSRSRYVGIWYNKVPEQTVVWVANRNSPITDKSGVLSVNQTGNLALHGQNKEIPFWSTKVSGNVNGSSYSAQLLDTGNLVLFHNNSNGNMAWQSFDYPTNNLLSYMKIGVNRRTGLRWHLTSWKSPDDPATGEYSYEIDINGSVPQLLLYRNSGRFWRAGPWNGLRWSGIATAGKPLPSDFLFNSTYINNDNECSVMYATEDASVLSRVVLNETSGVMQRLLWSEEEQRWVGYWSAPKDQCDGYAHCGAFGNCNPYNAGEFGCKCLPGFEPKSKRDWYLRDGSDGCVRQRAGQVCGAGDGFLMVPGLKGPDTTSARMNMNLEIKGCEEMCLTNCTCTAYASADVSRAGIGCIMWHGDLVDIRELPNGGQDVFVRVDAATLAEYSKKSKRLNRHVKVVILILSIAAVLGILLLAYWVVVRKKRVRKSIERDHKLLTSPENSGITSFGSSPRGAEMNENGTSADVQFFSLSTIIAATGDFAFANRLGEGGFGTVYKGQLLDGQEIAVKRLSNGSKQGTEEFRNEVTLIAKLQHRNLVRLLGYCIEKKEKMLIYEYLPNKGLDYFIFNKAKGSIVDWRKRFDITLGIARGMLYLHQDSRFRIIHRDLKASNILLDASMNPKISDFGMARIFGADQMEETTKRVVGTYGYMSPEYAMEGIFSIKSDVFSFGVLHLEIISGRRNMSYYQENSVNLIGHVWNLWREGKSLEIIDPSLCESYDVREALRCIHIGLLCVQESADIRPTMSEVVFMLCNETTLPSPSQPAFISRRPDTSPALGVGAGSNNAMTASMIQGR